MQKQMNNAIKAYPINDSDLAVMQKSFPQLYNDMVVKYGEYAVKNNFLVKFQILTEGAEFTSVNEQGQRVKKIADKQTLELIVKLSKLKWYHYFTNFMNGDYAMKSKFNRYPTDAVGYVPIIGNHDDKQRVENKYGWIVSSSLELKNINGKWAIVGNGVLVNPIAKFNHINDNWFEVSPTINKGVLDELSYVLHPAQEHNTSFSREDNQNILENTNLDNTNLEKHDKIELSELELMANQYFQQQEEYNAQIKQHKQNSVIDVLKQKQIISDGQADKLSGIFSRDDLSSADIVKVVAEVVSDGTNPYANKPKLLKLEGSNMNKSYDDIYKELAAANPKLDSVELHKMATEQEANQFSGKFNRSESDTKDVAAQLKTALEEAKAAGLNVADFVGSFSTPEPAPAQANQPIPPNANDVLLAHQVAVNDLKKENAELTAKLADYQHLEAQVKAIKGVN